METIKKADLIDGMWYVGRTSQRGMPVGMWWKNRQVFCCIKPELGGPVLYEMNHVEDPELGYFENTQFQGFDPVKEITSPSS